MRQPAISVKSLSKNLGGQRVLDDRNEVGAYAMVLALAVISFCLLWVMEYARKHAQDE